LKIYIVSYQFGHHYTVSGYNRLSDFMPCTRIAIPAPINSLVKRFVTRESRERLKETTGLLGYFPECRLLESWLRLYSLLPGRSIFHFIYPENSYYFSALYSRSRGKRFVASYHQPVGESRQFIRKTDAIRRLDAVILLSDSQREFFEPIVGPSRIFVVPHGVDTGFFRPADRRPTEKRMVAVGTWLRDFPTLAETLRILKDAAPDIVCDVVTVEEHRRQFAGLPNVRVHSGISDSELLALYQRASLAALSLHGAAANNALLEALACGLPIVATDIVAVREYTTSAGASYVPASNAALFADAVQSMFAEKPETLAAMGVANREHSRRFSWEEVATRMLSVYRTLE